MEIEIDVTQEHIDNAHPPICRSCPVALAVTGQLRKIFGNLVSASVGPIDFDILILGSPVFSTIHLPVVAQRFIRDYDGKLIVHPFKFTIEIHEKQLEKIWAAIHKVLSNRPESQS